MKSIYIQWGIAVATLSTIIGCAKDLGNYNYHDINELQLSGFATSYTAIASYDTLTIDPIVESSQGVEKNTDHFEYAWVVKKNDYDVVDTIGHAKQLRYFVTLTPANYKLQLRVKDRETDIVYTKETDLSIGTVYAKGLLLIGENEQGNAEASMISMLDDTLVINDLLANSGLPPLKAPLGLQHTGNSDDNAKLWVLTNTGSYYLDKLSMKGDLSHTFGQMIFTTDPIQKEAMVPIEIAPHLINRKGDNGIDNFNFNRAILCASGDIFTSYMGMNSKELYGNPINRDKNNMEKLLKAAPYLLYSAGAIQSLIWYDTENDRFMNYSSFLFNTSSLTLTDNIGDKFPWNQSAVGRKLVYGENTRNTDGGSTDGNSFAIMKDNEKQYYIYKLYAKGDNPAKRDAYTIKPSAIDFDKAKFYAFSSKRSLIFYAVDNKLYAYDYNPGNEKLYQFPEITADEITMLKFDMQINPSENSLYIATYNEHTKGTLRRYLLGSDPNTAELTPVKDAHWTNLIKVININWRATD